MSTAETYGVGDGAKRRNFGKLVGQVTRLDETGKATQGGDVVFDPKVDKIELVQDDGKFPGDVANKPEGGETEDPADDAEAK